MKIHHRKPESACCSDTKRPNALPPHWAQGTVTINAKVITKVSTLLTSDDRRGSLKARWGIGRMRYYIRPGLYALGAPDPEAPVLVTANYKMSFDKVRASMHGRAAWLLVLDTKGINVWCAAGKGTFGTQELIKRIKRTGLSDIVSHRRLILPQLGAPGVNAPLIRKTLGFRVIYGPVRAEDLPAFIDAGYRATAPMRKVSFTLRDRTILAPIELVGGIKYAVLLALVFVLIAAVFVALHTLPVAALSHGITAGLALLAVFASAAILGPVLLPWLPGRPFAVKGAVLGLLLPGMYLLLSIFQGQPMAIADFASWSLLSAALASFTVMNFTGASTFTSLSGVLREMRLAMPLQGGAYVAGLLLWILGLFSPGGAP